MRKIKTHLRAVGAANKCVLMQNMLEYSYQFKYSSILLAFYQLVQLNSLYCTAKINRT